MIMTEKVDTVENTYPEPTVIAGEPQVRQFVWLQTMHKLALELNSGLKAHRQPILAGMYRAGMIDAPLRGTAANKRMVLAAMVEALGPEYTPSASIVRALSS
jgi:hypothetical protein